LNRNLEVRDVDAILAIQAASPEIAQWTSWDYARVARGEMAGWIGEEEDGVAGFLIARAIGHEIEILNFAVDKRLRGRGIGTSLLHEAFQWGKAQGAERAFLEVRTSNSTALKFYEGHGFQTVGRRRSYYIEPIEDALVLSVALPAAGSDPG
jgi:[ribosomal protein S18]-alanine N-acetyltransferase